MSGETDDSKFPPNPYMGESDTCSCTSCELYYMGDGYCSTCDGDYGEYNDDDIYGGGSGNGNLTYTKGASIYDVRTKEPKESARNSKNPAQNSTSSKVETRRGSSSNDASIDGGKSKAAVEAAGRDKGKRNGSVSSNEGSKVNMNRDHRESGRTNRERNSGKSSEAKISSSESARTKRFSVSSSAGSDSKKVSTKTTSAASSFSSRLGGGGSRRRSQEIVVPIELDPNSQRDDDSKFPPKQNYGAMADLGGSGGAKIISGDEEIYRAVGVGEIQRQKNERVLRRHLRDLASDWNSRIDDLNTLRRTRVIKELKRFLRGNIDLDRSRPEEIGRQVDELLRTALDSNFEALSNLNLGHMYVPMEERQRPEEHEEEGEGDDEVPSLLGGGRLRSRGRGLLSRETTGYDTFGSIDSLIFEPKLEQSASNKNEDIKKAHKVCCVMQCHLFLNKNVHG